MRNSKPSMTAWMDFKEKLNNCKVKEIKDWNIYSFLGYSIKILKRYNIVFDIKPVSNNTDLYAKDLMKNGQPNKHLNSNPSRHPAIQMIDKQINYYHHLTNKQVKDLIDWSVPNIKDNTLTSLYCIFNSVSINNFLNSQND